MGNGGGCTDCGMDGRKASGCEVFALISCHCHTGCSSGRCSCIRSGLLCIDVCNCDNCENQDAVDELMPNSDHSADEENDAEVAAAEIILTNEVKLDW